MFGCSFRPLNFLQSTNFFFQDQECVCFIGGLFFLPTYLHRAIVKVHVIDKLLSCTPENTVESSGHLLN